MNIVTALASIALVIAAVTSHRMHPLSDEFIDFINSNQTLWRAGRNFHRDTPLEHLKKLMGTKKIRSFGKYALPGKPPPYKNRVLKSNFDARKTWNKSCGSILNAIRDQGSCGSCWAVSTASTMSDRLCIQSSGRISVNLSELDLMSCCMICGSPCTGGILKSAWQYGVKQGIVTGGEYHSNIGCRPYSIPPCYHNQSSVENLPCGHSTYKTVCKRSCVPGFGTNYKKDKRKLSIFYNHTDISLIMLDIQTYGPVTTSFDVYEDFFSYQSGVYRHVSGNKVGYHSVKLLGWGEEGGVPYWLAANSWNTDWGLKGFFKFIRGQNHLGIEDIVYTGLFKTKSKKKTKQHHHSSKFQTHWKSKIFQIESKIFIRI